MSGGNGTFQTSGGGIDSSPIGNEMQMSFPGIKLTDDTSYGIFSTPIASKGALLSMEVGRTERLDSHMQIPVANVGQHSAGQQIGGMNKVLKGINMNSRIGAGFGQSVGG